MHTTFVDGNRLIYRMDGTFVAMILKNDHELKSN